MLQDLTDDKSTLVQIMAWCRQATSHYLSQCWLSSLSPYGVIRPQWVKDCLYRYMNSYHKNKTVVILSYLYNGNTYTGKMVYSYQNSSQYINRIVKSAPKICIWFGYSTCSCLVTWFCYQLIAKPGNKTAALPWPDPSPKCNFFCYFFFTWLWFM